jgi:hypothetical protein
MPYDGPDGYNREAPRVNHPDKEFLTFGIKSHFIFHAPQKKPKQEQSNATEIQSNERG